MTYEATHRFSGGGFVSGSADVVEMAARVDRTMQEAEQEWVASLRRMDVKLAHPDDGWVNRTEHYLDPCYPQLLGLPEPGDLIALGWPSGWFSKPRTRILRVTEVRERSRLFEAATGRKDYRYYFDPEPVHTF